jgi:hypothetical protein
VSEKLQIDDVAWKYDAKIASDFLNSYELKKKIETEKSSTEDSTDVVPKL